MRSETKKRKKKKMKKQKDKIKIGINITDLLILYAQIYSSMNVEGKKKIEEDIKKLTRGVN
jgi:tRNA threonylcarbamoyladenosine modification (KEOPS) complex  Pcc1 subunit